jgi:integrase
VTDTATRRPKRKSFMADTKTCAKHRADEWRRANGETVVTNSTVTVAKVVSDFVRRFEQPVASGEREYNTLELYRLVLKKIEADMIGELPVSKLTTAHVERMLARMLTGTRRQAKMSTSYVRLVRSVLSRSMPAAIKAGYLLSNPVTGSRPIKPTVKPRRALSDAEVERVLDAAWDYDPQIFTLISLLVGTDVRRGEVLGLQWSDLDPDKPRASIVRQVKRNKGKGKEGAVKTTASVRVVPLPENVIDALRAHRAAQDKERANAESRDPSGWVFANGNGGYLDPVNISKDIKAVAEDAAVAGVGSHRFRYTAITKMAKENVHVSVAQEDRRSSECSNDARHLRPCHR